PVARGLPVRRGPDLPAGRPPDPLPPPVSALAAPEEERRRAGLGLASKVRGAARSSRVTPALVAGLVLATLLLLFCLLGPHFVDHKLSIVGAVAPDQHPSSEHWLGSDTQGRDIWTLIVLGTPSTLKIGLIAATVGVTIGVALGLLAGYFGGAPDAVIRIFAD